MLPTVWRILKLCVAAGLAVLLSHFRFRLAKEVCLQYPWDCCLCLLPCIYAPSVSSQGTMVLSVASLNTRLLQAIKGNKP